MNNIEVTYDILEISEYMDEEKISEFINSILEYEGINEEESPYVSLLITTNWPRGVGVEGLPITLVDGEIVVSKTYPTTKQLSEWTGINLNFIPVK